ncbi:LysM peptidoglycan-binding domain-containing protein, partial [Pseudonocardia zijingensis]
TPVRGASAAMAEATGTAQCSGPGCVAWGDAGTSGVVGDTPTAARCRAGADGCAVASNATAMRAQYTSGGQRRSLGSGQARSEVDCPDGDCRGWVKGAPAAEHGPEARHLRSSARGFARCAGTEGCRVGITAATYVETADDGRAGRGSTGTATVGIDCAEGRCTGTLRGSSHAAAGPDGRHSDSRARGRAVCTGGTDCQAQLTVTSSVETGRTGKTKTQDARRFATTNASATAVCGNGTKHGCATSTWSKTRAVGSADRAVRGGATSRCGAFEGCASATGGYTAKDAAQVHATCQGRSCRTTTTGPATGDGPRGEAHATCRSGKAGGCATAIQLARTDGGVQAVASCSGGKGSTCRYGARTKATSAHPGATAAAYGACRGTGSGRCATTASALTTADGQAQAAAACEGSAGADCRYDYAASSSAKSATGGHAASGAARCGEHSGAGSGWCGTNAFAQTDSTKAAAAASCAGSRGATCSYHATSRSRAPGAVADATGSGRRTSGGKGFVQVGTTAQNVGGVAQAGASCEGNPGASCSHRWEVTASDYASHPSGSWASAYAHDEGGGAMGESGGWVFADAQAGDRYANSQVACSDMASCARNYSAHVEFTARWETAQTWDTPYRKWSQYKEGTCSGGSGSGCGVGQDGTDVGCTGDCSGLSVSAAAATYVNVGISGRVEHERAVAAQAAAEQAAAKQAVAERAAANGSGAGAKSVGAMGKEHSAAEAGDYDQYGHRFLRPGEERKASGTAPIRPYKTSAHMANEVPATPATRYTAAVRVREAGAASVTKTCREACSLGERGGPRASYDPDAKRRYRASNPVAPGSTKVDVAAGEGYAYVGRDEAGNGLGRWKGRGFVYDGRTGQKVTTTIVRPDTTNTMRFTDRHGSPFVAADASGKPIPLRTGLPKGVGLIDTIGKEIQIPGKPTGTFGRDELHVRAPSMMFRSRDGHGNPGKYEWDGAGWGRLAEGYLITGQKSTKPGGINEMDGVIPRGADLLVGPPGLAEGKVTVVTPGRHGLGGRISIDGSAEVTGPGGVALDCDNCIGTHYMPSKKGAGGINTCAVRARGSCTGEDEWANGASDVQEIVAAPVVFDNDPSDDVPVAEFIQFLRDEDGSGGGAVVFVDGAAEARGTDASGNWVSTWGKGGRSALLYSEKDGFNTGQSRVPGERGGSAGSAPADRLLEWVEPTDEVTNALGVTARVPRDEFIGPLAAGAEPPSATRPTMRDRGRAVFEYTRDRAHLRWNREVGQHQLDSLLDEVAKTWKGRPLTHAEQNEIAAAISAADPVLAERLAGLDGAVNRVLAVGAAQPTIEANEADLAGDRRLSVDVRCATSPLCKAGVATPPTDYVADPKNDVIDAQRTSQRLAETISGVFVQGSDELAERNGSYLGKSRAYEADRKALQHDVDVYEAGGPGNAAALDARIDAINARRSALLEEGAAIEAGSDDLVAALQPHLSRYAESQDVLRAIDMAVVAASGDREMLADLRTADANVDAVRGLADALPEPRTIGGKTSKNDIAAQRTIRDFVGVVETGYTGAVEAPRSLSHPMGDMRLPSTGAADLALAMRANRGFDHFKKIVIGNPATAEQLIGKTDDEITNHAAWWTSGNPQGMEDGLDFARQDALPGRSAEEVTRSLIGWDDGTAAYRDRYDLLFRQINHEGHWLTESVGAGLPAGERDELTTRVDGNQPWNVENFSQWLIDGADHMTADAVQSFDRTFGAGYDNEVRNGFRNAAAIGVGALGIVHRTAGQVGVEGSNRVESSWENARDGKFEVADALQGTGVGLIHSMFDPDVYFTQERRPFESDTDYYQRVAPLTGSWVRTPIANTINRHLVEQTAAADYQRDPLLTLMEDTAPLLLVTAPLTGALRAAARGAVAGRATATSAAARVRFQHEATVADNLAKVTSIPGKVMAAPFAALGLPARIGGLTTKVIAAPMARRMQTKSTAARANGKTGLADEYATRATAWAERADSGWMTARYGYAGRFGEKAAYRELGVSRVATTEAVLAGYRARSARIGVTDPAATARQARLLQSLTTIGARRAKAEGASFRVIRSEDGTWTVNRLGAAGPRSSQAIGDLIADSVNLRNEAAGRGIGPRFVQDKAGAWMVVRDSRKATGSPAHRTADIDSSVTVEEVAAPARSHDPTNLGGLPDDGRPSAAGSGATSLPQQTLPPAPKAPSKWSKVRAEAAATVREIFTKALTSGLVVLNLFFPRLESSTGAPAPTVAVISAEAGVGARITGDGPTNPVRSAPDSGPSAATADGLALPGRTEAPSHTGAPAVGAFVIPVFAPSAGIAGAAITPLAAVVSPAAAVLAHAPAAAAGALGTALAGAPAQLPTWRPRLGDDEGELGIHIRIAGITIGFNGFHATRLVLSSIRVTKDHELNIKGSAVKIDQKTVVPDVWVAVRRPGERITSEAEVRRPAGITWDEWESYTPAQRADAWRVEQRKHAEEAAHLESRIAEARKNLNDRAAAVRREERATAGVQRQATLPQPKGKRVSSMRQVAEANDRLADLRAQRDAAAEELAELERRREELQERARLAQGYVRMHREIAERTRRGRSQVAYFERRREKVAESEEALTAAKAAVDEAASDPGSTYLQLVNAVIAAQPWLPVEKIAEIIGRPVAEVADFLGESRLRAAVQKAPRGAAGQAAKTRYSVLAPAVRDAAKTGLSAERIARIAGLTVAQVKTMVDTESELSRLRRLHAWYLGQTGAKDVSTDGAVSTGASPDVPPSGGGKGSEADQPGPGAGAPWTTGAMSTSDSSAKREVPNTEKQPRGPPPESSDREFGSPAGEGRLDENGGGTSADRDGRNHDGGTAALLGLGVAFSGALPTPLLVGIVVAAVVWMVVPGLRHAAETAAREMWSAVHARAPPALRTAWRLLTTTSAARVAVVVGLLAAATGLLLGGEWGGAAAMAVGSGFGLGGRDDAARLAAVEADLRRIGDLLDDIDESYANDETERAERLTGSAHEILRDVQARLGSLRGFDEPVGDGQPSELRTRYDRAQWSFWTYATDAALTFVRGAEGEKNKAELVVRFVTDFGPVALDALTRHLATVSTPPLDGSLLVDRFTDVVHLAGENPAEPGRHAPVWESSTGSDLQGPVILDERVTSDVGVDRMSGVSIVGRRPDNQDAAGIGAAGHVVAVVADGVSRTRDGQRSENAHLAARAATDHVGERLLAGGPISTADAAGRVVEAIEEARHVVEGTEGDPATTIITAVVTRNGNDTWVTVGWLGDSRAYWVDRVGAHRLTDDLQSEPGRPFTLGGAQQAPGVRHFRLAEGGVLLLATDGLTGHLRHANGRLTDRDALRILRGAAGDPRQAAADLTVTALGRGSADNITTVLVPVGALRTDQEPADRHPAAARDEDVPFLNSYGSAEQVLGPAGAARISDLARTLGVGENAVRAAFDALAGPRIAIGQDLVVLAPENQRTALGGGSTAAAVRDWDRLVAETTPLYPLVAGAVFGELWAAEAQGVVPARVGTAAARDLLRRGGELLWVIRTDGSLWLSPRGGPERWIHHTRPADGGPVLAAGEIYVLTDGSGLIAGINVRSGHYMGTRRTPEDSDRALVLGRAAFARHGLHPAFDLLFHGQKGTGKPAEPGVTAGDRDEQNPVERDPGAAAGATSRRLASLREELRGDRGAGTDRNGAVAGLPAAAAVIWLQDALGFLGSPSLSVGVVTVLSGVALAVAVRMIGRHWRHRAIGRLLVSAAGWAGLSRMGRLLDRAESNLERLGSRQDPFTAALWAELDRLRLLQRLLAALDDNLLTGPWELVVAHAAELATMHRDEEYRRLWERLEERVRTPVRGEAAQRVEDALDRSGWIRGYPVAGDIQTKLALALLLIATDRAGWVAELPRHRMTPDDLMMLSGLWSRDAPVLALLDGMPGAGSERADLLDQWIGLVRLTTIGREMSPGEVALVNPDLSRAEAASVLHTLSSVSQTSVAELAAEPVDADRLRQAIVTIHRQVVAGLGVLLGAGEEARPVSAPTGRGWAEREAERLLAEAEAAMWAAPQAITTKARAQLAVAADVLAVLDISTGVWTRDPTRVAALRSELDRLRLAEFLFTMVKHTSISDLDFWRTVLAVGPEINRLQILDPLIPRLTQLINSAFQAGTAEPLKTELARWDVLRSYPETRDLKGALALGLLILVTDGAGWLAELPERRLAIKHLNLVLHLWETSHREDILALLEQRPGSKDTDRKRFFGEWFGLLAVVVDIHEVRRRHLGKDMSAGNDLAMKLDDASRSVIATLAAALRDAPDGERPDLVRAHADELRRDVQNFRAVIIGLIAEQLGADLGGRTVVIDPDTQIELWNTVVRYNDVATPALQAQIARWLEAYARSGLEAADAAFDQAWADTFGADPPQVVARAEAPAALDVDIDGKRFLIGVEDTVHGILNARRRSTSCLDCVVGSNREYVQGYLHPRLVMVSAWRHDPAAPGRRGERVAGLAVWRGDNSLLYVSAIYTSHAIDFAPAVREYLRSWAAQSGLWLDTPAEAGRFIDPRELAIPDDTGEQVAVEYRFDAAGQVDVLWLDLFGEPGRVLPQTRHLRVHREIGPGYVSDPARSSESGSFSPATALVLGAGAALGLVAVTGVPAWVVAAGAAVSAVAGITWAVRHLREHPVRPVRAVYALLGVAMGAVAALHGLAAGMSPVIHTVSDYVATPLGQILVPVAMLAIGAAAAMVANLAGKSDLPRARLVGALLGLITPAMALMASSPVTPVGTELAHGMHLAAFGLAAVGARVSGLLLAAQLPWSRWMRGAAWFGVVATSWLVLAAFVVPAPEEIFWLLSVGVTERLVLGTDVLVLGLAAHHLGRAADAGEPATGRDGTRLVFEVARDEYASAAGMIGNTLAQWLGRSTVAAERRVRDGRFGVLRERVRGGEPASWADPRTTERSALVDVVRWHVVLRALYDPKLPGRGFVLTDSGRRVTRAGVGAALAGFGDPRAVSLSRSDTGFPSAWGLAGRVYQRIVDGSLPDAVVEELHREAIAQARIVEEFSDHEWAEMLRTALQARTDYRGTGVNGAEELIERAAAHKNRQAAEFEAFWADLLEQRRERSETGEVHAGVVVALAGAATALIGWSAAPAVVVAAAVGLGLLAVGLRLLRPLVRGWSERGPPAAARTVAVAVGVVIATVLAVFGPAQAAHPATPAIGQATSVSAPAEPSDDHRAIRARMDALRARLPALQARVEVVNDLRDRAAEMREWAESHEGVVAAAEFGAEAGRIEEAARAAAPDYFGPNYYNSVLLGLREDLSRPGDDPTAWSRLDGLESAMDRVDSSVAALDESRLRAQLDELDARRAGHLRPLAVFVLPVLAVGGVLAAWGWRRDVRQHADAAGASPGSALRRAGGVLAATAAVAGADLLHKAWAHQQHPLRSLYGMHWATGSEPVLYALAAVGVVVAAWRGAQARFLAPIALIVGGWSANALDMSVGSMVSNPLPGFAGAVANLADYAMSAGALGLLLASLSWWQQRHTGWTRHLPAAVLLVVGAGVWTAGITAPSPADLDAAHLREATGLVETIQVVRTDIRVALRMAGAVAVSASAITAPAHLLRLPRERPWWKRATWRLIVGTLVVTVVLIMVPVSAAAAVGVAAGQAVAGPSVLVAAGLVAGAAGLVAVLVRVVRDHRRLVERVGGLLRGRAPPLRVVVGSAVAVVLAGLLSVGGVAGGAVAHAGVPGSGITAVTSPEQRNAVQPDRGLPRELVVQPGDTMWDLARSMDVPMRSTPDDRRVGLLDANEERFRGADPGLIHPGERLRIPPGWDGSYEVRWGDTFPGIAARFGVDPDRLAQAQGNGFAGRDRGRIFAGERFEIPGRPVDDGRTGEETRPEPVRPADPSPSPSTAPP